MKYSEIVKYLKDNPHLPFERPDEIEVKNLYLAVKMNCLGCCGGEREAVVNCSSPKCWLYPFRLGKNPFTKLRKGNTKGIEALKAWRKKN